MSGLQAEAGAQPLRRVVVIEDDAALSSFVAHALGGLTIELVMGSCIADATTALRSGKPTQLLLTDLNLLHESGFELLEMLAADPALRGPARIAAFSANLDAAKQRRLTELGVWRTLRKPVSMSALRDCVQDACDAPEPTASRAGAAIDGFVAPPLSADEVARATTRYFAGDSAIYAAFKHTCLTQFSLDVHSGDKACDDASAAALMHLAHSLKTVFEMLGYGSVASLAAGIETAAMAGDLAGACASWLTLRKLLLRLCGTPG